MSKVTKNSKLGDVTGFPQWLDWLSLNSRVQTAYIRILMALIEFFLLK